MEGILDEINITYNWKIINEKKIKNAVTVFNPSSSIEIDEIVSLDSCIAFSQQDEATGPLEIFIDVVNPGHVIKGVWLVSEAKILEVFGRLGEYESTTNAVNTLEGEDDDEMQVYRAKLPLRTPSRKCSIRFAGVTNGKKEMWLLGMGIVLEPCVSSPEVESLAKRVESILQDSKVPLSKSAENFKAVVFSQPSFHQNAEQETKISISKQLQQFEVNMMNHIDMRFKQMEEMIEKINRRLDGITESCRDSNDTLQS
ncbi:uncharacterized protein LOC132201303 [Neocloeon triangulifer]|uniref:uncharacterized protein LOC132201303 n=1 Tax=Neocloeon triangulifer TaxID=2078957 RepID=UPI00286F492C|nr:uncharacterized protein LOC132201303 [Neocloeon triangulifer]